MTMMSYTLRTHTLQVLILETLVSKGSRQRPIQNKQTFDDNWDLIFNKQREQKCIAKENCTETETSLEIQELNPSTEG